MSVHADSFEREIKVNALAMVIEEQVNEVADELNDVHVTITCNSYDGVEIAVRAHDWQAEDAPEVVSAMTLLRKHFGGQWEKDATYGQFYLTKPLSNDHTLAIRAPRQLVCTKRVIGTQTVTKPAVEAKPEEKVDEEIVEWDCPPSLLGASGFKSGDDDAA